MSNTNQTQETFKLDDPLRIEGKVTPEKAAAIIDRMNQLLAEEREALSKSREWGMPYYR